MRGKIDCFLPCDDLSTSKELLQELERSKTVQHVNLLVTAEMAAENCTQTIVDNEILGDKERRVIEDGSLFTIGATSVILRAAQEEEEEENDKK